MNDMVCPFFDDNLCLWIYFHILKNSPKENIPSKYTTLRKATLKKVIEIKTDEKSQTDFSTPIIARKKGQSYVFAGHPPTFAQRVVARMTLLLLW